MSPGDAELVYMNFPSLYLRNGVETVGGEEFHDITDWGEQGAFVRKARKAILRLASKDRGNCVLTLVCKKLFEKNRAICIEPATDFMGQTGSGWSEKSFVIRWSPKEYDDAEDWDQLYKVPPFIILGHELVHAMHTLTDGSDYGYDARTNIAVEEARTIGLGPWSGDALTEKGLRQEWGVRPRTSFQGATAKKLLIGTKYC
jgi:hypothetical protein